MPNSGFPPFVKGGGGDGVFELNEIRGELKFFKIKGGRKRGERGIFEIFIGSKIAGDETSTKFQKNLKCFLELLNKSFKQLFFLIVLSV